MRTTNRIGLTVLVMGAMSLDAAQAETTTTERPLALGAVIQHGGSLSPNASYSGAAFQLWPTARDALQLGVAVESEGDSNVSLHGEYQRHFFGDGSGLHSLFTGAGLFYEDAPEDDWVAVYAPLGFRLKLREYPIAFTVNTAARFFIDPESSVEIFDEVRLGAFYKF